MALTRRLAAHGRRARVRARGAPESPGGRGAAGGCFPLRRSSTSRCRGAARGRARGIVVHRSRCLHQEDRDEVRGIPVTSVARTLVDLGRACSTSERLAQAVKEAEIRRAFDLLAIERVLTRMPGRTGRHRLAQVLAAYRPDPHFTRSGAERRFLELCQRNGLPTPRMNTWVGGHEVDAYWAGRRRRGRAGRRGDARHAGRPSTRIGSVTVPWPPRASGWSASPGSTCRTRPPGDQLNAVRAASRGSSAAA